MAVILDATQAAPSKEQEAKELFEKDDYQRCLQVLDQVTLSPNKDVKVLHNRALADFYQAGGKEAQLLQERLQACQARNDELRQAAEAELDGAVSPSGATSFRESFSADGAAKAAEPLSWDYQTATLTYNLALVHYQQHRYSQAATLLEPLYTNLEPLDEDVALRVCLLLLDVHLANRQPAKAANVLSFLEKLFSVYFPTTWLSSNNRDERPRGRSGGRERGDSAERGEDAEPSTRPGTPAESSSVEGGHSRNTSEDNFDEDAGTAPAQSRGRNGKGFEGFAGFSKPLPIEAEDLKLRLHLGRARLLMLTQNLKSMKREVKAALALSKEHTHALTLKAQLECSRANYRKAIKLLVSAHTPDAQVSQTSRAAFLGNLGNVHHYLGKRSLASLYFSKALVEVPRSLAEGAQTDGQAVLYSAALEQLVAGNAVAAAQCFQQVGGQSALRLLRLGEACIAAHSKGLLGSAHGGESSEAVSSYGDKQVRVTVGGEGPWKTVVHRKQDGGSVTVVGAESSRSLEADEQEGGAALGGLSLGYAKQCLEKVLAVSEGAKHTEGLQTERGGGGRRMANGTVEARKSNGESAHKRNGNGKAGGSASAEDGVGSSEGVRPSGSAPITLGQGTQEPGLRQVVLSSSLKAGLAAYEAEQKRKNELIQQSARVGLAYVDLCLGNPARALAHVEASLRIAGIGRVNSLLARTYAAEALCLLGRPGEAINHLSVALTELTSSSSDPLPPVPEQGPVPDKEQVAAVPVGKPRDWQADLTGPGARAALYANLAALYAKKGELAEAQRCIARACQICRESPSVLLAGILVQLKANGEEAALSKLREARMQWVESSLPGQRT
ncbi:CCR4-NOT transcription complex subunit 10 [Klebsormidium nitens]|uniref:CCR4-NOT transcription complex subunit 10 n=1 Tax=Klebsormidium nitens TaxID=105231 RepID=A0A1Y1HRV1_KLENI|nr:CCR4-NOT transcription complex subunit 10 [Klebsormidium nitens]|eukprot:GAQ79297.1 CCR4-NOT transcription complex subunit 10 [Klebsormidium nitens]